MGMDDSVARASLLVVDRRMSLGSGQRFGVADGNLMLPGTILRMIQVYQDAHALETARTR